VEVGREALSPHKVKHNESHQPARQQLWLRVIWFHSGASTHEETPHLLALKSTIIAPGPVLPKCAPKGKKAEPWDRCSSMFTQSLSNWWKLKSSADSDPPGMMKLFWAPLNKTSSLARYILYLFRFCLCKRGYKWKWHRSNQRELHFWPKFPSPTPWKWATLIIKRCYILCIKWQSWIGQGEGLCYYTEGTQDLWGSLLG
jgi:hypothetical protein